MVHDDIDIPAPLDGDNAPTQMPTPEPRPFDRMQDLPLEIVSRVFIHCLPPDMYFPIRRDTAPLLFTQICRSWRTVALSTPQLWCSLGIWLYYNDPRPIIDMFHTWMARSGQLPFSLFLSQPYEVEGLRDAVADVLTQYLYRWRNILLQLHAASPPMRPILGEAPLLCDFELFAPEGLYPRVPISPTPNLRRFTWNALGDYSLLRNIPLEQLTQLSFSPTISMDDALTLLRTCVVLEECSLKMDTQDCSPLRTPLAHSTLQSSTVVTMGPSDSFLDSLVLPALNSISLEHISGHVSEPDPDKHRRPHALQHLFARSKFALRDLTLKQAFIDETDLIQCLADHHSLVTLDVDNHSYAPCVGDALLCLLSNPLLFCPRLESISFSHCIDRNATLHAIVGMVTARLSAYVILDGRDVAHLQSFSLGIHKGIYEACDEALSLICDDSVQQGAPLEACVWME
ncbi:hypothetical protein PLICRDRAFT_629807 [Plicaturopsis crispa FD-325 SS-3]|nr:hypothetical protein PLICRDRAFT_629807 [Plicaturopsis crispa FD-325 SS-3]